jgi:hypothetical protein
MQKSCRDRLRQPKQYVHPLHPIERTRYALETHRSQSMQCWQAMHPLERAHCVQSMQSAQRSQ